MKAPDLLLKGPRVTIRPLEVRDLDIMSAWPACQDPLYRLFDWPRRSTMENEIWFSGMVDDKTRLYYGVEDEFRNVIGRISLREIWGRHSARLGIGLGTEYVSQGYGTEALRLFLHHYFDDLGFERMVLDVSAINIRAVRCYERCGFRYVGSHYEYMGTDEDLAFLKEERYQHLRRFFRRKSQRNSALSYDMVLEKVDWLRSAFSSNSPR
jgi:RimJ/RimL family protein N-acetyltransferase